MSLIHSRQECAPSKMNSKRIVVADHDSLMKTEDGIEESVHSSTDGGSHEANPYTDCAVEIVSIGKAMDEVEEEIIEKQKEKEAKEGKRKQRNLFRMFSKRGVKKTEPQEKEGTVSEPPVSLLAQVIVSVESNSDDAGHDESVGLLGNEHDESMTSSKTNSPETATAHGGAANVNSEEANLTPRVMTASYLDNMQAKDASMAIHNKSQPDLQGSKSEVAEIAGAVALLNRIFGLDSAQTGQKADTKRPSVFPGELKFAALLDGFSSATGCGPMEMDDMYSDNDDDTLHTNDNTLLADTDMDTLRTDDDTMRTDDDTFLTYQEDETLRTSEVTMHAIQTAIDTVKRHANRRGISEAELLQNILREERNQAEKYLKTT